MRIARRVLAAGAAVGVLLLLAYYGLSFWVTAATTQPRFTPGSEPYRGAAWCAGCHPEHYRQWSESLHAHATRIEFRPLHLMRTSACYSCHGFEGGDEGVSCEVCHGPGHTAKRDFGPEPICARCHSDENPLTGVKVMLTHDEWLESQGRVIGQDCASCHMPRMGDAERPMHFHGFAGNVLQPEIYPGKIRIAELRIEGDSAHVSVENTVLGHAMPTGCPSKYIELELLALDSALQTSYRERQVFQRRMDPFMRRVLEDNRLRDGERRELRFALPLHVERVEAVLRLYPSDLWQGGRGKVITLDRRQASRP